jgi:hypothetical protein
VRRLRRGGLGDCLALLSVLDEQIRRLDTTLAQQWGTTSASSVS